MDKFRGKTKPSKLALGLNSVSLARVLEGTYVGEDDGTGVSRPRYKKSKQRAARRYLEVSQDPSNKTCSYPNKGREANGRGDMIKITNVIANC